MGRARSLTAAGGKHERYVEVFLRQPGSLRQQMLVQGTGLAGLRPVDDYSSFKMVSKKSWVSVPMILPSQTTSVLTPSFVISR